MANAKACGDFITITSAITKDQFKKVERYAPEAAIMKDEDGNEIFRIGFNVCSVDRPSKYGITYSSVGVDGKMFVQIPNTIQGDHTNIELERETITNEFAAILAKTKLVEDNILTVMGSIEQMEADMQSSISICGAPENSCDIPTEFTEE